MRSVPLYVVQTRPSTGFFWAAVGLSLVAHAGLLLYLQMRPPPPPVPFAKPLDLVVVEVPKPPEVKEEPKPAPPPPKVVKVKPPPLKVARSEMPLPPPPDNTPPPPNDPPPETPSKPVPLVVGISMSSTTSTGGFAAPVGNTTYGKTEKTAQTPSAVKAFSAPKYTPVAQVDSEPEVLEQVQIPYPAEAKQAGIEGTVHLSVVIDLNGQVTQVKVLSGPGYGLEEAARLAMLKFRFKPAKKGGEAVSTQISYNYTFELD